MIILVSDYDNTLGFHKKVSEKDLKAIEKFRKAGNLFFICTGRGPYKLHETINFETDGIISCSGGCFEINGEYKTYPIDYSIMHELIDYLYKQEAFVITQNTMNEKAFLTKLEKYKQECIERFGKLLDTVLYKDVLSTTGRFESEEKASEVVKDINIKFKDYLFAQQNGIHADISAKGISKVWACNELIKMYKADALYAIGDNMNDLEMIEAFNGACVKSGNEYVKEKASDVVTSVSEYIDLLLMRQASKQ